MRPAAGAIGLRAGLASSRTNRSIVNFVARPFCDIPITWPTKSGRSSRTAEESGYPTRFLKSSGRLTSLVVSLSVQPLLSDWHAQIETEHTLTVSQYRICIPSPSDENSRTDYRIC